MRLIDADSINIPNDLPYKASVRRVLLQTPTVKNAIALPFLPGDDLWYVDDEDDYKVKPYNDKVMAVAYFGGNRFRVVHKGGMFIPGEGNLCTSKEKAEALRDELLSANT